MTKYNASPVSSLNPLQATTKTDANTDDQNEKVSYLVAKDAHVQECCVNYEQFDTTSENESL
jgi:hypothetical protein